MAVKIIKGDLLNCGADIICHQTNFFGMMGGGVLFDTAEQAARYWNSGGNLMKKKAMISQPMNGKTDKEILAVRNQAINTLTQMGYQFVNSLFEDDGKEE